MKNLFLLFLVLSISTVSFAQKGKRTTKAESAVKTGKTTTGKTCAWLCASGQKTCIQTNLTDCKGANTDCAKGDCCVVKGVVPTVAIMDVSSLEQKAVKGKNTIVVVSAGGNLRNLDTCNPTSPNAKRK